MCYLPGFLAVSLEELLCGEMLRIQASTQAGTGYICGTVSGCLCVQAMLLTYPSLQLMSSSVLPREEAAVSSNQG